LFILAHEIGSPSFYSVYKNLRKNQWRPYEELKREQEKQLRRLIGYSYEQVPYYRSLFRKLNLRPGDFRTVEDLEKLPVLTKNIIKDHWEEFKPADLQSQKYVSWITGGSTGTPLQYRVSKHDRFLGGALLYRGWGYGGFELGDKMVFLAASSLDVGTKPWLVKRVHEISRNVKKLSSLDMGENEMQDYARIIHSFKPKFIRGYASSIYFVSKWIEKNDRTIHSPSAVFTTSEKLYPHMRKKISEVFGCEVFDGYGAPDGGSSAYECPAHAGLHVDTERSIMEIADKDGFQVGEGHGQILSTSLNNFSMPFIRYSTGDLAVLKEGDCACGRHHRLLESIIGRESEFLITPTGRIVHGIGLISVIFEFQEDSVHKGNLNKIKEFQIRQKVRDTIEISVVAEDPLPDDLMEYIRQLINERFDGWEVMFRFVDSIDKTGAGKHKFIINEMEPGQWP
jgi:phenylacetate-CoA ligase